MGGPLVVHFARGWWISARFEPEAVTAGEPLLLLGPAEILRAWETKAAKEQKPRGASEELSGDKPGNVGGPDSGESVAETASDCDGGVRE